MATPLKSKTRMQMLEELGPLSSGGIIAGTGGTVGQAFTGQQTNSDFVNAADLISANKGKGASMTDNALSGQIDSTADLSGLNEINGYDPSKHLTSTTSNAATNRTEHVAYDDGSEYDHLITDTTPTTTTTTYDGMSDADLTTKAGEVRGLKTQVEDFDKTLKDSPEAIDARGLLLKKKLQDKIPTYSAGQNAFDSMLVENEGQPAIANKGKVVSDLLKKFDGFDTTVGNVRSGITAATGKVGSSVGPMATAQTGSVRTKSPTGSTKVDKAGDLFTPLTPEPGVYSPGEDGHIGTITTANANAATDANGNSVPPPYIAPYGWEWKIQNGTYILVKKG